VHISRKISIPVQIPIIKIIVATIVFYKNYKVLCSCSQGTYLVGKYAKSEHTRTTPSYTMTTAVLGGGISTY